MDDNFKIVESTFFLKLDKKSTNSGLIKLRPVNIKSSFESKEPLKSSIEIGRQHHFFY